MNEPNRSNHSLAVGSKLYRVVEALPDGPDVVEEHASWMIQERIVRTLTAKTMFLNKPFFYCAASHGRITIDRFLGRDAFVSRADAVADFLRRAERRADQARRDLAEAERMVAWAAWISPSLVAQVADDDASTDRRAADRKAELMASMDEIDHAVILDARAKKAR